MNTVRVSRDFPEKQNGRHQVDQLSFRFPLLPFASPIRGRVGGGNSFSLHYSNLCPPQTGAASDQRGPVKNRKTNGRQEKGENQSGRAMDGSVY